MGGARYFCVGVGSDAALARLVFAARNCMEIKRRINENTRRLAYWYGEHEDAPKAEPDGDGGSGGQSSL